MFGFIEYRIVFFLNKKTVNIFCLNKTVKYILNFKQIINLQFFKKAHLKETTPVYMKTFQNEMVFSSAS